MVIPFRLSRLTESGVIATRFSPLIPV